MQQLVAFAAASGVDAVDVCIGDALWWEQVSSPAKFEALAAYAREARGVEIRISSIGKRVIRLGVGRPASCRSPPPPAPRARSTEQAEKTEKWHRDVSGAPTPAATPVSTPPSDHARFTREFTGRAEGACSLCEVWSDRNYTCRGCGGLSCAGCAAEAWDIPTAGFVKMPPACQLCRAPVPLDELGPTLSGAARRATAPARNWYAVCAEAGCGALVRIPKECGPDAPIPPCEDCVRARYGAAADPCPLCGEGALPPAGCNVSHCEYCAEYACRLCGCRLAGFDKDHFPDGSFYGEACRG